MSSTIIVTLMTSLIHKQFYATQYEAMEKLDVYYAMNRISKDEYANLVMLAENVYTTPEIIEEAVITK